MYRCRNDDYNDKYNNNTKYSTLPPPPLAKRGQWVKLIIRAGRSLINERDKPIRYVYTVPIYYTRNDNNNYIYLYTRYYANRRRG